MSNFRTKAREIKAAAETERGNFQPTGAPLRLYNYWLARTSSSKGLDIRHGSARENFCHFWRVVAIWAPFMWVRRTAENVVTHPVFIIGLIASLVIGVVVAGVTFSEFGLGLLITLGIGLTVALGVFGLMSGVALAFDTDHQRTLYDLPNGKLAKFGMGFLPTSVPAYLITKLARSGYLPLVTIVVLVVALIGILTVAIIDVGFWAVAGTIGLLAALVVGVLIIGLLFGFLSNVISGRRRIRRQKIAQAREDYYNEHKAFPEQVTREPGKLKKFLTGAADFLIFVSQVIRVKKWKICPTVEINK